MNATITETKNSSPFAQGAGMAKVCYGWFVMFAANRTEKRDEFVDYKIVV